MKWQMDHTLGPAAKCITCAKGQLQHDVVVCLCCLHHLWSNAEHSGHMWMLQYQATDAGVVTEGLRTWLKPMMQSNVLTCNKIDAALTAELEVCYCCSVSLLPSIC
jgi:hypothetical protein